MQLIKQYLCSYPPLDWRRWRSEAIELASRRGGPGFDYPCIHHRIADRNELCRHSTPSRPSRSGSC